MATFPYAQPIGALGQTLAQLRKRFPDQVDSSVLKKLGIAPNNESYIINTLKFLGVIDKEGQRTKPAHDIFVLDDDGFAVGLAGLVERAYKTLFDIFGDGAWTLEKQKLVNFLRSEDKSTELVGGRQADTFIRLAEISAKRSTATKPLESDSGRTEQRKAATKTRITKEPHQTPLKPGSRSGDGGNGSERDFSLAVRIEVVLPADASPDIYDAIFKSIRTNLMNRD